MRNNFLFLLFIFTLVYVEGRKMSQQHKHFKIHGKTPLGSLPNVVLKQQISTSILVQFNHCLDWKFSNYFLFYFFYLLKLKFKQYFETKICMIKIRKNKCYVMFTSVFENSFEKQFLRI